MWPSCGPRSTARGNTKKNGKFSTLSGNDQLIIWNLLAGGTGGIAGCANVYPPHHGVHL